MTGEAVVITVHLLNVRTKMKNALSAVYQHRSSVPVRHVRDLTDRIHAPGQVGDLRHSHQTVPAAGKEPLHLLQIRDPVRSRTHCKRRPPSQTGLLPGNKVGMMLQDTYQNPCVLIQMLFQSAADQVDAVGRPLGKYDVLRRWSMQERCCFSRTVSTAEVDAVLRK